MSLREIKYADTNSFSKLLVDYSQSEKHFSKLISHFPSVDNLKKQISSKSINFNHSFRKLLVEEIYDQYEGFKLNEIQKKNIDKLLEKNTFTITTGHQLNLLTGPLYFIYKIISVINLCENMQKNNTENNFVPVFWMASEDHDFAEINHFSFKDEKFLWPSKENGIVGEFKLESIEGTIDRFEKYIKGFNYTAEIIEIIRECYLNSVDLSNATRKLVNILFSKYGLIIIDANNKNIKTLFKDLIFKEVSEKLIHNESKQSIEILNELGYDIQANPREINLFYIEKQSRERITLNDNNFQTLSGSKKWNLDQIKSEISDNPEKFSPNVLFRPVFQEYVLPNICYIGGPAEVSYWLQLKSVFDSINLDFPIILNRNSALLLEKKTLNKIKKLDISIEEMFLSERKLKDILVRKYSKLELDFTDLKQQLINQFSALKKKAKHTDKSFIGALSAQEKKQLNGLKMLEKRLIKSENKAHNNKINRVIEIRKKLFPNDKLQERSVNFFEFYVNEGVNLIDTLKNNLDPLNQKFSIIEI